MILKPGQLLSHFRLGQKIGAGGMGVVYRARDEHLERDVAVKVLAPGLLVDESARVRFRNEALALSKLNHSSIAAVYDFDTQDETDFLVMEYVRGTTLNERLSSRPLDEKDVLRLGLDLMLGLEAAHKQGIVHRDLKPGNLRVTNDGRLKILDFGLAKLLKPPDATATATTETLTRGVVGTIPYMAPEQLSGGRVDARTDVYAAGNVLYEMATGRRPFDETNTGRLVYKIAQETPRSPRQINPGISETLAAVILKALEKDPDKRYQTAEKVAEDLRRLGAGAPVSVPLRRAGWQWRSILGLAAAGIVALGLMGGFDVGGLRSRLLGGADGSRIESLAVLPLENLSGNEDQDFFADGMTETLITDLGRIEALQVISRYSVMQFRDSELSLGEIADRLGVEALVVGSVVPVGSRVRVTAQLIDAATERQLWSDRYEKDLSDVLEVQSEIATDIARQVEISLTPEEEKRLSSSRRVDPAAHDAFLRGRHYLAQFTRDASFHAVEAFDEAIEIDSNYAEAYASLAYTYFLLGQPFAQPDEEMMPRAREAAHQALALDGTLVEAHLTLGYIRMMRDYDWKGARDALRRAVDSNPSHALAHSAYAFYLSAMGRHDDAIFEARRALELDPLHLTVRSHLVEILWTARRYQAAEKEAVALLRLDPKYQRTYKMLRYVYELSGQYEDAIAAYVHFRELSGESVEELAGLSAAFERGGAEGYWSWTYEDSMKHLDEGAVRAAQAAAICGRADEAVAMLERAYENREGNLAWLAVEEFFDPIRDDPRFQDLLHRMGLD